jgi:hypothetical protein
MKGFPKGLCVFFNAGYIQEYNTSLLALYAKLFMTSGYLCPQSYMRQYSISGDSVCGRSSLFQRHCSNNRIYGLCEDHVVSRSVQVVGLLRWLG